MKSVPNAKSLSSGGRFHDSQQGAEMVGFFNLAPQEILVLAILAVGGVFCTGVVVGLGVLLYVLKRRSEEPRNN